jgi:isopentenyl-diphosphate delta-isomerase
MELVVLVDEYNNEIGTAAKETVHSDHTPLHRGFSLFVFNTKGDVLVTKRAATKKTFPDIWTNAVCGHPSPHETVVAAAIRRLKDELGITGVEVQETSPYRYRFVDKNGIVENEICPILVTTFNGDPSPTRDEVGDWKWVNWNEFLNSIKINSDIYSPWCIEEAEILRKLFCAPKH